ncbi:trigger factor [Candidatus Azambacteria bacterium]|nr:trigger factor [Candidatus Azambacteria bacterium]
MEGVVYKKLPGSQVSFEVTVSAEELKLAERKELGRLAANLAVKGFRKGKAPEDIVRQHVGDAGILEEASRDVIEKKYIEALTAHEVKPLGHPQINVTKIASGNPLVFSITVATHPSFTLADHHAIAQKLAKEMMKPVAVEEQEIQDALAWLQRSRKKEALVARPAQRGDKVEVNFETRQAGVKIEGGESRNHPVVIGDNKFILGFEDQLIGMQAHEEKQFSVKAAEDYAKENLRGRVLDFTVTMNAVYAVELPTLDDAFAQSLGKFENLEAIKTNITEGLQKEKEEAQREEYHRKLAEEIATRSGIEIGDLAVAQEADSMIREFQHNVEAHGFDFDTYCANIKRTRDDLKKDFTKQAEMRLKVMFALAAIAEKENIVPTEEEVEERFQRVARQRAMEGHAAENNELLRRNVFGIIQNEKVFALLESRI